MKSIMKEIARDFEKARNRAARYAARRTKVAVIKYIRKYYVVKAATLRNAFVLRFSFSKKGVVTVSIVDAKGESISLIDFGNPKMTPRPKKYKTGKVGGTRVTKRRGSRQLFPHAFIAQTKSGRKEIFMRKKDKSFPIVKQTGPTPGQMLTMKGALRMMEDFFFQEFEKEFDRLMNLK